ncbi:hypothetical protein CAOG_07904 [Capsaspora owczarzaki ATCC 30864]|uniref:FAD-binding domain-containing protein n=1 Tax=Capsaspora owczarzaki (strain ATCC 30864) TaxID=595528 RepID=A0A0D2WXC5_CAPO3|nr:hypothetical protein CAOG_07904 [Capsaspora owczarzaki ATCC 30864]KJE97810.1 hypothetical protein CAOG_007904 [Capsaspora owczarzaki ATCC 30864]|eukprot:XP_004342989.1 hypothetical protein CAOG_07904 [Capsaspora owczarzaki ATCC 30864]
MPLRVVIVGGGIGGLVLAQLLRAQEAPVQVDIFERDSSADGRDQGYYINLISQAVDLLKPTFGNLPELARLVTDPRSQVQCKQVLDTDSKELLSLPVPPGCCFVNRIELRKCLLDGLTIHWNKRFESYEESADDKSTTQVRFRDGSVVTADILVGADGANSRVREQRAPGIRYEDLGFTTVAGLSTLDAAPPAVRGRLDKGLVRWLGRQGHTAMMFPIFAVKEHEQPLLVWIMSYPGQRAEWETKFAHAEEDVTNEYSESNHARQALLDDCIARVATHITPDIAGAIRATKPDGWLFGPRQVYSTSAAQLPSILDPPSHRVVLLGDAAHATTTHRGLGANSAIADAADLAAAILKASGETSAEAVPKALQQYDRIMVARGGKVIGNSLSSTYSIHAAGWTADWICPLQYRAMHYIMKVVS